MSLDTSHSAITLRMKLAEIAPRKAAALWGAPEVIEVMNKHFADVILAAKAEEREACAVRILGQRYVPLDMRRQLAAAIRKRGEG